MNLWSQQHQSQSQSPMSQFFKLFLALLAISSSFVISLANGVHINSNGGYEDIVVTIGKEVPPIACQQLIQNIQVKDIKRSNSLAAMSFFCPFTVIIASKTNLLFIKSCSPFIFCIYITVVITCLSTIFLSCCCA